MADCDKDQECEKIVPEPIKPEPLPKQCSGGGDESGSGTNDFNELENRPKYGGRKMTGETNIPDLSSTIEQLSGEINIKTPMITNYDGEVGENVTDQRPYIVTEDKDSITPEELVNETTIDGASLVVEVDTNEGTATLYTAQIVTDAETGDYAIEWSEVGGGSSINVVQTTGSSETDVMSQKATTDAIPTAGKRITINNNNEIDFDGLTILSYGTSTWQDFLDAYNDNAIVYCRASSSADPSSGTQGRLAFMAFVTINGTTPTAVEFQYYRSVSTKSASQQGDQVIVYKLESTNGGKWTVTTREAATKIVAGTGLTSNYNDGTLTLDATGSSTPYNVYSTKTTSNNNNYGGAIYLGALDSNQEQIEDPTTTDNHYRYFHALPYSKTKVPTDRTILIGSEVVGNPTGYIGLGFGGTIEANDTINIGGYYCGGNGTVVLGKSASWRGGGGVSLGYNAGDSTTYVSGAVNLGAYSKATRAGEVNVGSANTSFGFNNTNYRVIGGVHDGQDAHDVATIGQITPLTDSTAPTTSTVGTLGKIYIDTSTATAYMCVEVDNITPSYTWKQITA
jgi:hypothetical protein